MPGRRAAPRAPPPGPAGALVVHRDQRATVLFLDAQPDPTLGRGVANRVRQQVFHDPLHLRRVDVHGDALSLDDDRTVLDHVRLLDHPSGELRDVRWDDRQLHRSMCDPDQVQQVADHAIEAAGVVGDPRHEVLRLVGLQGHVLALQGDGESQDRGEWCPEVVQERAEVFQVAFPTGGHRAPVWAGTPRL